MKNNDRKYRLMALVNLLLILLLVMTACGTNTPMPAAPTPLPSPTPIEPTPEPVVVEPTPDTGEVHGGALYLNPELPVESRVEDLLARMTLAEKIGQMTQIEKDSLPVTETANFFIGSVLSGGGGAPNPNNTLSWAKMVDSFQEAALSTRLGIPILYGVDAIHGHGNLRGATFFPHNIGLGATRDPELVQRIGRATALEMAATGIRWNFGPVVAVAQDIRWGRTYEAYSERTDLVTTLSLAYLEGLQNPEGEPDLNHPLAVLGTPKHFVGDGGTVWGSSTTNDYKIDQGDLQVSEENLRILHLPPYETAIEAGAQSIMVSFSSWNGEKMHAQRYLLSEVLKGELGFEGFLISDWQAIDQISGDYYNNVVISINAGLDMIMVPYDYRTFISTLTRAVENGDVSMERIDDAVRRILTVKVKMGLFENPYTDTSLLSVVGSEEHRTLAREAVAKSLVLLKNENQALPLAKDSPTIFVAGAGAHNIGMQLGGWSIDWQGRMGEITSGTTILQAIQKTVGEGTKVRYNNRGRFDEGEIARVCIAVVGETPYAEGPGDRADLSLYPDDKEMLDRISPHCEKLVVIMISGRPMIVTDRLPDWDAFVAAWLPGTEGQGVVDALFGDIPFTGKLSFTWPESMEQIPFTSNSGPPLFPYGYGLETAINALQWELVWSDEFEGESIDMSKWTFDTGGHGWGNNEKQYYTDRPENARLEDGFLIIEAREEPRQGLKYTSARLKTEGLHTWTYGRFEARIKVPSGQGLWPAFWMLGEDIGRVGWPACGEIDILENIGREPGIVHGTVHGPGYSGSKGIGSSFVLSGQAFAEDFHVFAVEWEPEEIRWFMDGALYNRLTPTDLPERGRWVFDHPFFIIMNVAVGGHWPGNPNENTVFPQKMMVDYVRVYQEQP